MRSERISRLAARRQQYTNETYQQARNLLRPGRPPIPDADCDKQRNFEADLFHQLIESNRDFTAYPFGIRRVSPKPDTIELVVESEQRARRLLSWLLPCYEPGGEVHGVLGLRIRQRTVRGVELHLAGQRTSVWLTGPHRDVWKSAENESLEHVADLGWKALWRGPEHWSAEEVAFEHEWNTGEWTRQFRAGAWSASGLLRRLGLFRTLTAADAVTGYKGLGINGYDGSGPVRWCLDIIHRSGIRHRKQHLIEAITDPEFGLPVSRADHLDAIYPPETMENWIRLDDEARTGLIELRFTTCDYEQLQLSTCGPEYQAIAEAVERRISTATQRLGPG
ncbi:hypothetical protein AQJ43_36355 [Streptomyces avermitilis]|nr:hypothetical protein [Streptomyces avermitilis]KUN48763.1 hypothetical protein AQJ43_36355 [Streptomyces avermitilis]BBJ56376.1 hypothetical protein SAVMC3_90050 [Streptomyces avermitilis]GDY70409.1 hypothetical protein SAV14893_098020 [Streptomyces avermitilis]GDY80723.1 hypothetical protein SAV31267_102080 [Streptomyces avermitilis]